MSATDGCKTVKEDALDKPEDLTNAPEFEHRRHSKKQRWDLSTSATPISKDNKLRSHAYQKVCSKLQPLPSTSTAEQKGAISRRDNLNDKPQSAGVESPTFKDKRSHIGSDTRTQCCHHSSDIEAVRIASVVAQVILLQRIDEAIQLQKALDRSRDQHEAEEFKQRLDVISESIRQQKEEMANVEDDEFYQHQLRNRSGVREGTVNDNVRDPSLVFASSSSEPAMIKDRQHSPSQKRKLDEMEHKILCIICMERDRNMAFLCGHTVCSVCGDPLEICHMCREPIEKKINLYY